MVSAGCAVGLGNVWKFPYICGQNGGAAFILIYLIFLGFLGFPILISEFAVGRGSVKGIAKSFDVLEPEGSRWHYSMSGGRVWGAAFFVFMFFAALSTIIAVYENILVFYMELFGWSRKKSVILNIILIPILSIPAIWGFNVLSAIQPFGLGSTIMDLEDFLVSYNFLPLGGMIYVLFCTRKNGWGWSEFLNEVNTGSGIKLSTKLKFYFSNVLPIFIFVIYLKGYYDMFATKDKNVFIFWMVFAVAILALILAVVFSKGKTKKHSV